MQSISDPRQQQLFDPFERIFSPLAYKTIQNGWQGLFRHVILELLPAEILAGEFHPDHGRPTKELYSMAGLIFMSEFLDWNTTQAAEAYMFRSDISYALNLKSEPQSMSTRTIERYQKLFRENDLANGIMNDVTSRLVELLEQNVSEQRLDSTHVFSDMASFGRTRLMGVTIKRFLTQVIRHSNETYEALPEELRERYKPSQARLFADTAKGKENRRLLRQQVAEDMYTLVEHFVDDDNFNKRQTFKMLCTVFKEQCDIVEDKIEIRKKTGGSVIQNPSDPDATYDGHKGPGYQVQIAETCSEDNEVQLITCGIPQTASDSDTQVIGQVCESLEESGRLPEQMLADTLYGSDDNVQKSAKHGIELLSPVSGKYPVEGKLTIGDFTVDEKTETVTACPAGYTPSKSIHNPETGKTRTMMAAEYCNTCVLKKDCPVKRARRGYRFDHTAKQRRLDKRRRDEDSDEFRKVYSKRAGIESTNSGIKRRTGMSRLRVRGEVSVYQAIVLKLAGWNILQAARTRKAREYVKKQIERVCSLPGLSENQGILHLSGVKSLRVMMFICCTIINSHQAAFQPLLQAV
jgi:hypothetical protein